MTGLQTDEQLALLKAEEKGYSAAFGQLLSERQSVTNDSKGLFDQLGELKTTDSSADSRAARKKTLRW